MAPIHSSKTLADSVAAVYQQIDVLQEQAHQLPETQRMAVLTTLDTLNTAQQDLFHQYHVLETVLQASPLAVVCLDADAHATLWNPAAETVFGWSAGAVLGQPLPLLCDESETAFRANHTALLAGQQPPPIPIRCQHKNGQRVTAILSSGPLFDRTGSISGVVYFFSDVTDNDGPEKTHPTDEVIFRSVIEQSTDGVVLMDDRGLIVEWNRAQEQSTGIPRDEAIGQYMWDVQSRLMPQDKRQPGAYESIRELILSLLANQDAPWLNQLSDIAFQRPDGTYGVLQTLIFPIHANGRFLVGNIARDVTEQRRTEKALRESEERFRAVFESAQDAIYIKDRDLVYTHVNPIVEKQNNKSAAEIIGRTTEELFGSDPEAAAQTREVDLRVLAGEVVEQVNIKPTGGIPHTYHSFKVPIRNQSGEIIGICGFARDITERQRAADQLKESEARYRALVNNSPVGIFVIEDGHYVLSNPAGAKLLGLASQDDIIGIPGLEPIAPEDRARIQQRIDAAPEQVIPPIEITLNRSDGTSILVESTAVPIRLGGKNAVLVISHDVNERRIVQQQALALEVERQHSQLLAEFIQNVSHEFRTPLSIINTNLYLLSRTLDSPHGLEKIQRLEEQTRQITELIQAMLTMSRLDGGMPLSFAPANINQLLEDMLIHIQPLAEKKSLSLSLQPIAQPTVEADSDEMYQALLNIFDNALNFTEAGGTITARIDGDVNQVTIAIQDTGIGIEARDLSHVFERFYRADKARTTRGAGLGLSIAKKIIESHNGRIAIDSTSGEGTTVTITLPREQGE